MSKICVKKPFTVLVGVIIAIVLGAVSIYKMQLDLLPNISLPYMIVVTTYPGASPELVEEEICKPMENALGTINGVENVFSSCSENYGLVELEFQEGTNLDSAMVKVSSAINTIESSLPDECGTPSIMEISTDMMASVYLAVGLEDKSIEETTQFVKDDIIPEFEKQDGVASVTSLGLVEKSVQIELNEDKVRVLNDKILGSLDSNFEDAVEQLNDAKKQLKDSEEDIAENKEDLEESQQDLEDSKQDIRDGEEDLKESKEKFEKSKNDIYDGRSKLDGAERALSKSKEEAYKKFHESEKMLNSISESVDDFSKKAADDGEDDTKKLSDLEGGADFLDGLKKVDENVTSDITIAEARDIVEKSLNKLEDGKLEAAAGFGAGEAQIEMGKQSLDSAEEQLTPGKESLDDAEEKIADSWEQIDKGQKQIDEGWEKITEAEEKIADGWEDYNDAVKNYQKQRREAEKKANADELLDLKTLSQLIYAQNFEMPAGYIDDELDNSWLVKVGQKYQAVDEIGDIVLCNMHNVGDVKLSDVSDISIIDNAADSYVRLGDDKGVILEIFKSSTAGTNDISKVVKKTIDKLEKEYPDLHVMIMSDQGEYIDMIVESVLQSMAIGAVLAIFILAIFLKDFKPTVVVAISIPLSVFVALICMYFSHISLNMLSLSGLSLGIGMLVDNSIVVIENIYRLRGKGVEAPRAAVQGTKQVAGAIISSTLTTVCVFLPMIYTTGIVNELMAPMCLTIVYCLMASLLIAMTVVPAASSTVLRNAKPKEHKLFEKIQDAYANALSFCLKKKAIPLISAIALLLITGFLVIRMGIVMMPDMTMSTIQATITYPDEYDKEKCYELTDKAIERVLKVEGVASVGTMAGDDSALFVSETANQDGAFRNMQMMFNLDNPDAGEDEIKSIMKALEKSVADLKIDFEIASASSEMDSMMGGSGLSINVYGDDLDTLLKSSHEVMDIVGQVEGYENIKNGEEDADKVIHLVIDKNKAMNMGLSVAQIYSEIADKIDNEETAVSITVDGIDMDIKVVDNIDELTKENLMDFDFQVDEYDSDDDQILATHTLGEFAEIEIDDGVTAIDRKNQSRYMTVTADVKDGYNITLLTRELEPKLEKMKLPSGYSYELGGEYDSVLNMIKQMLLVVVLGCLFIYLVMVAQFQSLLSPFIVLFTIPLAFTGGFLALFLTKENISAVSMMGFIVLMGTVVNNGIVFVDYANQLRKGGMQRHDALVATGKTRMRPIMMTALTTILAESNLIIGDDMGAQLSKGMALVIAGGLLYATLMTLFIIPIMYDILFKKQPLDIDTGSESLDDVLDDAQEFLNDMMQKEKIEE